MDGSSIPWPQLQFTTMITQVVDDVLQRRKQSQGDAADEADISIIWNMMRKDQDNPYGDSFVQNQK